MGCGLWGRINPNHSNHPKINPQSGVPTARAPTSSTSTSMQGNAPAGATASIRPHVCGEAEAGREGAGPGLDSKVGEYVGSGGWLFLVCDYEVMI